MKKPLLLFVLSFLFSVSNAQGLYFEHNFQGAFYNHLEGLRAGAGGVLFLPVMGDDFWGHPGIKLLRVEPAGGIGTITLFDNNQGVPFKYDFLPLPDGYLSIGTFAECDLSYPWKMFRHDSEGTILWQTEIFQEVQDDIEAKLLPGLDSTSWIVSSDGSVPLHFHSDGQFIEYGPLNLPLFSDFVQFPDNDLLMYGKDGLARCDGALSACQFGLAATEVLKADTLAGNLVVAITADSLFVLNADFDVLKAIKHGIPAADLADMDCDVDRIRILKRGSSPALLDYNPDLAPVANQPVPGNWPLRPQFLHRSGNRLVLAGMERKPAGVNSEQVVSVRAMPADAPDFDITADAAVTGVHSPENPLETIFPSPTSPSYSIQFDSVSVTIKNEGDGVLQQFTLHAVLTWNYSICGHKEERYRNTFYNMNIAPGDSRQIQIGQVYWKKYYDPPPPSAVSLCFWTTLPNDSLDGNTANNYLCKSFSVTVPVVGPAQEPADVQIFPNPASDACIVQLPGEQTGPAVLRLFDGTGRLVQTERFTGIRATLERKSLRAGIYNILIISEEGQNYAAKVIFD